MRELIKYQMDIIVDFYTYGGEVLAGIGEVLLYSFLVMTSPIWLIPFLFFRSRSNSER